MVSEGQSAEAPTFAEASTPPLTGSLRSDPDPTEAVRWTVPAIADRDEDLEQFIGSVAQQWQEALNEGLRHDADRLRDALLRAQRKARALAERRTSIRFDAPEAAAK